MEFGSGDGRNGWGYVKDARGSGLQSVNIPRSSCRTNSSTAAILVLGFHSLSRSMPRHMVPVLGGESFEILGW